MRCSEPPVDCAIEHVLGSLRDVKCIRTADEWSARCPHCGHLSLSFGIGTRGRRFVWRCHYKPECTALEIRNAMIARGVHDGCLPRIATPGELPHEERDRIIQIILNGDLSHGAVRLLIATELMLGGKMPAGRELDDFADRIHVSHATAYRERSAAESGRGVGR